eukprot:5242109-Alexandrium_andersonii.AAC.1
MPLCTPAHAHRLLRLAHIFASYLTKPRHSHLGSPRTTVPGTEQRSARSPTSIGNDGPLPCGPGGAAGTAPWAP